MNSTKNGYFWCSDTVQAKFAILYALYLSRYLVLNWDHLSSKIIYKPSLVLLCFCDTRITKPVRLTYANTLDLGMLRAERRHTLIDTRLYLLFTPQWDKMNLWTNEPKEPKERCSDLSRFATDVPPLSGCEFYVIYGSTDCFPLTDFGDHSDATAQQTHLHAPL